MELADKAKINANNTSTLDITVPDLSGLDIKGENKEENVVLTATDIIYDTAKAGELMCEPVAIGCSAVSGAACFLLACLSQAEDNNKPATRRDVIHADQIQRREKNEREAAGNVGVIVGAAVPRAVGFALGGIFGVGRAAVLLNQGETKSTDDVLCFSKESINNRPGICSGVDFDC
ncbi:MAG: hypothetical protein P1U36_03400 [Legionellaceae bacterium]|nr:hypothetical protein [Legionellaceae bacterium]